MQTGSDIIGGCHVENNDNDTYWEQWHLQWHSLGTMTFTTTTMTYSLGTMQSKKLGGAGTAVPQTKWLTCEV